MSKIVIFVDRLHWLWLVLAAPFLFFPSPKRSLAMLVVPAIFLLHGLAESFRRRASPKAPATAGVARSTIIPVTPLNSALLLLFIMVLVSLGVTADLLSSLPKVAGMVLAIGIFFTVVRSSQDFRGWVVCLLVFICAGGGIAAAGLLGTTWFASARLPVLAPLIARLPRLLSGLQGSESGFHPNEVAGALLWVLPVMAVMSVILVLPLLQRADNKNGLESAAGERRMEVSSKQKTRRIVSTSILLLVSIFTAMVFLLTQSRGGLLAFTVTVVGILLISLPARWRAYGFGTLAVLLGIVAVLVASHWDAVRTWMIGSNIASESTFSLTTLQGRFEIWGQAISAIRDFPFTGMGMNIFRKAFPILYPVFNIPASFDVAHAHNEFLQAALDLGIPGLVAFIALYIGAFWMLVRLWKLSRFVSNEKWFSGIHISAPLFLRASVLGLGGGLLAHLLYGLTDAVALGAKPGFLFWMLLALICGLFTHVSVSSINSVKNPPVEEH